MYFLIKVIISAVIIAAASELAKHHRVLSAVIVSLPLTSLLAIVWIYVDLRDREKIILLSQDILWLVVASMIFFIVFPLLLRQGINFWGAFFSSCALTSAGYGLYLSLRGYLF